jgi:hypothetical protein
MLEIVRFCWKLLVYNIFISPFALFQLYRYCQCFAAKATCSSSCRCVSCENRPDNAAVREAAVGVILERNPNAFDSKYRPTAPLLQQNLMVGGTAGGPTSSNIVTNVITSIAHKNGCRCRKSLCLKKYCECFQGGVPCSSICTCLSCQNLPSAYNTTSSTEVQQQSALLGDSSMNGGFPALVRVSSGEGVVSNPVDYDSENLSLGAQAEVCFVLCCRSSLSTAAHFLFPVTHTPTL